MLRRSGCRPTCWTDTHVRRAAADHRRLRRHACIVLPVFYFTYTYFVVSDYLASLCTFIFGATASNLGLFFGSYTAKLLVALLVISIAPLAAIIVDLFSYEGERLQFEILVDVASSR